LTSKGLFANNIQPNKKAKSKKGTGYFLTKKEAKLMFDLNIQERITAAKQKIDELRGFL